MSSGCIIGATRWDAWYTAQANSPAVQTAVTLGPNVFQPRAPIHATVLSTSKITFTASQAIIDAEITAAVSGGLKYWAFLLYGNNPGDPLYTPGMGIALSYYQSSSLKGNVNWCMMNQPALMGSTGNFSAQVAAMVTNMSQSYYQKVSSGRPLLYIYWTPSQLVSNWGNSLSAFGAMITALRAACSAASIGNPYIVVMNGAETSVYSGIGADAISNYVSTIPQTLAAPYTALDASAQAYWATLAATSVPIVPIGMCGWDPRPRFERPQTFNPGYRPFIGENKYVVSPTPSQLATHCQNLVNYINANPSIVPSTVGLLYAWDECDEGGWLLPTIGDPTGARLAAIAPVIS